MIQFCILDILYHTLLEHVYFIILTGYRFVRVIYFSGMLIKNNIFNHCKDRQVK